MSDSIDLAAAVQHLHFAATDLTWAAVTVSPLERELKIASALRQITNCMKEISGRASADAEKSNG